MRMKLLNVVAISTFFAIVSPAWASSVILDTIPGTEPGATFVGGGWQISPLDALGESVGIPFSSPTAATITAITAYIEAASNPSSIDLGIMADTAGVPSGVFLDQSLVSLGSPPTPVLLNSLAWSIAGGTTYWLVAVATDGSSANWQNDGVGPVAFHVLRFSPPWFVTGNASPEAEIFGDAAATPLPSTWLMLLSGFAGFGFLAYRRTKKSGAALAAA